MQKHVRICAAGSELTSHSSTATFRAWEKGQEPVSLPWKLIFRAISYSWYSVK